MHDEVTKCDNVIQHELCVRVVHVVSVGGCGKPQVLVLHVQVNNPEKYGFNPKELLNHLTDIYLHLRGDVLARAIATDERSYRKELFETCTELLRNKNIKSEVRTMCQVQYVVQCTCTCTSTLSV